MITSKIAANQAFAQINRLHRSEDNTGPKQGHEDVVHTAQGEVIDGIKADISVFSTNPLQHFNAEFNAVVKSIRIADRAMGEIEANVEQMESEVEMFMKQYPPFPPGSEDRIKYLSRFALLRRQIDQLTVPPDAGARSIVGPSASGQSKAYEIEIGGRKIGGPIRRQPVHTGQEGLNLPEISTESTDQDVARFHQALGKARGLLRQRRAALTEDATQVIRFAERAT
jgi:archaellum component FlaC